MNFGIIGYGRFGKLWANELLPFGEVLIYDKNLKNGTEESRLRRADLTEITQVDILFLVVPIAELANCCNEIKDYLSPNTLIVDCCSVKVHPVKVMQEIFPAEQALLATHPLFGPDSVDKNGGLKGHKMVICPLGCDGEKLARIQTIFKEMGLTMLVTTPEEHDKQMANSQGLVHFIGRGIAALDLKPQQLATPDFQALLNIQAMVLNDSWQLFLDMHRYNPYTKAIRTKLIKQLISIEDMICEEGKYNANH